MSIRRRNFVSRFGLMAVIDEDIWPMPSITEKLPADPNDKVGFSDYIPEGRVVYKDVLDSIYNDANEEFGADIPTPSRLTSVKLLTREPMQTHRLFF